MKKAFRKKISTAALSLFLLLSGSTAAYALPDAEGADTEAPMITAPDSFEIPEGSLFSLIDCERGCPSIGAVHTDDSGKYGRFSMTKILLNGEELPVGKSGAVHYSFPEAGEAEITVTAVDPSGNASEVTLPVTVIKREVPTVEEILTAASEITSGTESVDMSLIMDIRMSGKVSGRKMDLDIAADLHVLSTVEPEAAYLSGSMNMLGIDVAVETYTIREGDMYASYIGAFDMWEKSLSPTPEMSAGSLDQINGMAAYAPYLTLSSDTEMTEMGEAYVLTGSMNGSLVNGAADMSALTGADVDLSDSTLDMCILVLKDTFFPYCMVIDIHPGESAFSELGMDELTFETYRVTSYYHGFDCVDPIIIPEEILRAAEEIG